MYKTLVTIKRLSKQLQSQNVILEKAKQRYKGKKLLIIQEQIDNNVMRITSLNKLIQLCE